jgi:hypothetical protein
MRTVESMLGAKLTSRFNQTGRDGETGKRAMALSFLTDW